MRVKDIMHVIESEIAPLNLACDWDSPGLETGSRETEISKILVCLDVTSPVVEEAVKKGCNMIVSHHPSIFHRISEVTVDAHNALCSAIKNDIALYAAHTNLDFAQGGVNDALASVIGLSAVKKDTSGQHRYGSVSGFVPLEEFITAIKNRLEIPYVSVIIPFQSDPEPFIEIAGVSCGAYDGETDWIYEHKIDVLVTGEIKHSDAVALSEEKFITIGAGHYFTEFCGVRKMAEKLNELKLPAILSEASRPPLRFI